MLSRRESPSAAREERVRGMDRSNVPELLAISLGLGIQEILAASSHTIP